MSVEALAIVLHHSKAKGTALLVALGIANHEGDGGAWPSMATLAKYARVDVSNARKGVRRLQELGEVAVDVQAGGTHETAENMRPNRYRLLVSCPPWCDRTAQHRDTRKGNGGGPLGPARWTPPAPVDNPPGGSAGGALPLPGGGSGSTTRTTHKEHVTQGGLGSTDRARDDRGPCLTCGAADVFTHEGRNSRVPLDDRHPYAPRPLRSASSC